MQGNKYKNCNNKINIHHIKFRYLPAEKKEISAGKRRTTKQVRKIIMKYNHENNNTH